ncbi:sensor histidine kinase [Paenibacillus sp. FSL W8-1187]|uniref:sensor histidine kinase n=1 Tax=unclassified Paenibacillus TaxID=185978 RepID=UPI00129AEA3E|nr:sensor histidine kinase [Paenibacillus sp. B01]QGG58420.1 sensor histidine kinase [Paenibacillus sp. B01]
MRTLRLCLFPALAVLALLAGWLHWPSLLSAAEPGDVAASAAPAARSSLDRWQVLPIPADATPGTAPPADADWLDAELREPRVELPKDAQGIWIRLRVPATEQWHRPGLLAGRMYSRHVQVYERGVLLYESSRGFDFDQGRLLVPLDAKPQETVLDVRILNKGERAGFLTPPQLGEFDELDRTYIRKELPSLLLGVSLVFLAAIMFICSSFLSRRQRGFWISLCLIALSAGLLISAYSPLLYLYFPDAAQVFLACFELSLFTMFPALGYFVNEALERKSPPFQRFTRWQTYYSAFGVLCFVAYRLSDGQLHAFYDLVSVVAVGFLILVQMVWISILSIAHTFQGDRQARILSLGLLAFAVSSAIDLILFYGSGKSYVLFLWKLGIVALIFSLVVILARRVSSDYKTLVSYSKQLEQFNLSLERTEKLKIISDLAASVAHEVRNPLQVTRGFLQLLSKKEDPQSQDYITIAVSELDRAAEIITDFLTFAKPDLEMIVKIDLHELLEQLDLIMGPHAAMHGGRLVIISEEGLEIMGSPSKLKQALINLIKNSVEAFGQEGIIELTARAEGGEAVLRLKDNGEGMDEEQLAKLGVPYFSTKTKGTGLGTMVTMRIIEVMNGSIDFRSEKGKGTEVTIRFPLTGQIVSEMTDAISLPD